MTQFHRKNIEPEWMDLIEEFPHIFLEPSPEVLEYFEEYKDKGLKDFPDKIEDLCNLRYGIECPIEWYDIIREFCLEMDAIMLRAKENGDDFRYYSFILKQKFNTCRDQGSAFGADVEKYKIAWGEATERLYEKSKSIF